jgi:hypothetical protein
MILGQHCCLIIRIILESIILHRVPVKISVVTGGPLACAHAGVCVRSSKPTSTQRGDGLLNAERKVRRWPKIVMFPAKVPRAKGGRLDKVQLLAEIVRRSHHPTLSYTCKKQFISYD